MGWAIRKLTMRTSRRQAGFLALVGITLLWTVATPPSSQSAARQVLVIQVEGVIAPS